MKPPFKTMAILVTLSLSLPNTASALRTREAGELPQTRSGLEEALQTSPAAGLEEALRFIHESGRDPRGERQNLTSLGLDPLVPPLDPLEAAVIKAFVRQSYYPLNRWNKTVVLEKGKSIRDESIFLSLTRSEMVTFLNLLWDHRRQLKPYDTLERMRWVMSAEFRKRVFEKERPRFVFHGPSIDYENFLRLMGSETAQWMEIFSEVLDKFLNNSGVGTAFIGLQEWKGRYYQRVPSAQALSPEEETLVPFEADKNEADYPSPFVGRFHLPVAVQIPLEHLPKTGLLLRFGEVTLRWEWMGPDTGQRLSERAWRIVRPEDNKILFDSGQAEVASIVSADAVKEKTLPEWERPQWVVVDSDTVEPRHALIYLQQVFGERRSLLVIENHAQQEETWVERVPSPAAGLEEENFNRILPQLADSIQGTGVVVIGPEALESRAGLEELVRRAPPDLLKRMFFYAVGAAWAARLHKLNPAAHVIPENNLGKLAALLISLPEADRVTVLGTLLLTQQLQQVLPATMAVTQLNPTAAFRLILAALGVPASVLKQVDAAGLEESLARAQAA